MTRETKGQGEVMKPKPKKTKRKPAAIVVGRDTKGKLLACTGAIGTITKRGSFYGDLDIDDFMCVGSEAVARLGLENLKPGQYIRFVQDGGVRKARRVK